MRSLRALVLLSCLVTAYAAPRIDAPAKELPRRPATQVIVEGLGPMMLPGNVKGAATLRIFNPLPVAIPVTVGGDAEETILLDDTITERAYVGTVIVEAPARIVVTKRESDMPYEVMSESLDPQYAARPLRIAAQADCSAPPIETFLYVCKGGFGFAKVADAGSGATYEWSGINAFVASGQGTNEAKFTFASTASNASISVIVTTASGCRTTSSATVTLQDPLQLGAFGASSSPTVGSTMTLSWSYIGGRTPVTQKVFLTQPNGSVTEVALDKTARSYQFVPTTTGSWSARLETSLYGSRRRSVRSGPAPTIPYPSTCATGARTVTFTVSEPCNRPNARVTAPGSVDANDTFVASMPAGAASYSWEVGNGTIVSSAASRTATIRAGSSGTVTVIGRASNGPNCDASDTKFVTIIEPTPPPTVTGWPESVPPRQYGQGFPFRFRIEHATSWSIASSLGNCFSVFGGTGNGSFESIYSVCGFTPGADVVTLMVTGTGGTIEKTAVVNVNCGHPGALEASDTTITQGATTTLTVSSFDSWTLSSAKGNPLSKTSGGGLDSVTFTGAIKGTDTITLTWPACPGEPSTASVQITVQ